VTQVAIIDRTEAAESVHADDRVPRWLPHLLRATALGLGALHTFTAVRRQSMNEDGINYLDMGSAITAGDWHTALNAIWSPLYSVILGVVVGLVQPSAWWEFPVVQMTNFVIFAFTLICFEFFWRELTTSYHAGPERLRRWPAAAWLTLGYSLWIWSSLALITLWAVTPDMLVAACVYVASGLLLRVGRRPSSRSLLIALGLVLGLGYLAKAALFPLGLVCLVLVAGVLHGASRTAPRVAWAVLGFGVIAGPIVLSLSVAAGYVTFGDVGRFTYMKHVNRLRYPHWEETIAHVHGTPLHPPRRVLESPPVYEFASPVPGTYPMSFDPGYWTRGLSPRIDPTQQVTAMASNGLFYFDLFVRQQGVFIGAVLLLLAYAARPRDCLGQAALVLWSSAAFALYSLVYVTPRYVAPFVVIFWAGLLACTRLPAAPASRKVAAAGAWILVAAIWINIGAATAEGLGKVLHFSPGLPSDPAAPAVMGATPARPADPQPAIAEGLRQLGLKPGDTVGFVGYSFSAFWARLARVRIVAELEPRHAAQFWSSSGDAQSEVLGAFASAGVVAVVAEPSGDASVPPGWSRIPETQYLVYFLRD
jgi:hypothetical protein